MLCRIPCEETYVRSVTSNSPALVEIECMLLYSQRTTIGSYLELTKCCPCFSRHVIHLNTSEILSSQILPHCHIGYFRGNVKHCTHNDNDDGDNSDGDDGDDDDDNNNDNNVL